MYAHTVIAKDAAGNVTPTSPPQDGPAAAFLGLLTGSLLGLLGGPLGVAVGAGAGTVVGAAFTARKAGFDAAFFDLVASHLTPGKPAVVAELEEEAQTPLDIRMEALRATVFRRTRSVIEDVLDEKEIASYQAEIAALENEQAESAAERRTQLEAKVDFARRRLTDVRDHIRARLDQLQVEWDAKTALVQEQLTTAREQLKGSLERRKTDVRRDYEARCERLRHLVDHSSPDTDAIDRQP